MRKNKEFVRNIMIFLVVSLVVLMIVLFGVLQSYLNKNSKPVTSITMKEEKIEPTIELSETFIILIEKITSDHIMGYDIHNDKTFSKVMDQTVKVSDAYGNVLPLSQLKVGDIVEIDYQSQKDKIVSIEKSSSAHTWSKISGVTINEEEKRINVAGKSYNYTDELIVADCFGLNSSISRVSAYDIVSMQAIDDIIWSITIEEASASLNLSQLPTSNGQIEIGNSRLIMFKDITEPIRLVPGKHKIVIKMKGYTPIATEIIAEPSEVYEIILQDAEIAYTYIKPNIYSTSSDYEINSCTIKVGDKNYKYGEEIKVQQEDTYRIEISAPEHQKWVIEAYLAKPEWQFDVPLVPIEEEDTSEDTTSSNTSSTEKNDSETSENKRVITINTDPSGANVYINGELKGTTPYALELKNGTYTVLLEKVGYETYSANILLDGSSTQGSYLYQLKQKE